MLDILHRLSSILYVQPTQLGEHGLYTKNDGVTTGNGQAVNLTITRALNNVINPTYRVLRRI